MYIVEGPAILVCVKLECVYVCMYGLDEIVPYKAQQQTSMKLSALRTAMIDIHVRRENSMILAIMYEGMCMYVW